MNRSIDIGTVIKICTQYDRCDGCPFMQLTSDNADDCIFRLRNPCGWNESDIFDRSRQMYSNGKKMMTAKEAKEKASIKEQEKIQRDIQLQREILKSNIETEVNQGYMNLTLGPDESEGLYDENIMWLTNLGYTISFVQVEAEERRCARISWDE